VIPADSTIDLAVTADRGRHRQSVRDLGLTIDAEPIAARHTSFRTMGAGETYTGVCAENCGPDRASASTDVIVVTDANYRKWLTSQDHAIAAQGAQVSRLRTRLIDEGVFARPSP
jgi:heme/copper-type cytochrome/quinol oxidase subunit 2